MENKFKSRKFLICLAASLGSVGTSIAGLCIDNMVITVVGAICTAASAGIYTFCEAWVDGKAINLKVITEPEKSDENVEKYII